MAKFIENVKPGQMIDIGGSKKIVTSVHPYIVTLIDPSTSLTSTANVGDLVIAGIESSSPSTGPRPKQRRKELER